MTERRVIRQILRCGGCGNEHHRIHVIRPDDGSRLGGGDPFKGSLETECIKCGSLTRLDLAPPSLLVNWAASSGLGIICEY